MGYICGEDRQQMSLTALCLDDYIASDSICRVILAFVSALDMAEMGFKYSEVKNNGRPPYNPASMLTLYLYGYLNRIRSSRRLQAETQRNIEVMWLMEKLTPDDKTICNFRKDNAKALKNVFRQFSLWCNEQELYGKTLVAVDGSKFRANASRKSIHTQKNTEKKLAEVEKKISEYMNELERNDEMETDNSCLDAVRIAEVLKSLNEKKELLQNWLVKIKENDGNEISVVDTDARLMHTNGDGRALDACYNVQIVADSKHNIIVDFDVSTCADDKGALVNVTESAKEIMGVEEIDAIGDRGYYDGEDIARCEKNGTTCYIPKMISGKNAPDVRFNKEHFTYDKDNDCYICPQGATLLYRRAKRRPDGKVMRLYYNFNACKNCDCHTKCTKSKYGRELYRTPHQDALDIVDYRMDSDQGREIFRQRKKIVEHPFGTTKSVWGFKQFLCRGREKTTGEMALTFLAYNLRRIFNIYKQNEQKMLEIMG